MTELRIDPSVLELYPRLALGVVTARGLDNRGELPAVAAALRLAERRVIETIDPTTLAEHPRIAPWREAYRRFGAKPKDYPSSVENLVRRVAKGLQLAPINTLVDLYNAVSLRHLLPVGGEDLDQVAGDIELTRAGDDEPGVLLLGEPEARPPKPGEVIYRDERGAICRRFNWKEADRTKLTAATTRAVLVIEALPPVSREDLERALGELAAGIETHCGGLVAAAVLDAENPRASLR